MEKKNYVGIVSKATSATMTQIRMNNGIKKEIEVKGLQVTFSNFVDAENKELKTIETIDKDGNLSETMSIFIPFCKLEQLFVWGILMDYVRITLPVSENIELQRVLAITLIGEAIQIESIKYQKGEFLSNENEMIVRNYKAAISLEKFEAIALKLQERADNVLKEKKEEEKAKTAEKAATQTAAVFGTV